jgi:hypothetical protein
MKLMLLSFLFLSSNALACWQIKGSISYDGSRIMIDQRFDHDKTYSFLVRNNIIHLKVPSSENKKEDTILLEVKVDEKTGTMISESYNNSLLVKEGQESLIRVENLRTKKLLTIKTTIKNI